MSTGASREAPFGKRARQDCNQKRALSAGASREAPVDKRARQDCNQKRALSTGASLEAPVDKRARQDCNPKRILVQVFHTFPLPLMLLLSNASCEIWLGYLYVCVSGFSVVSPLA